MASWPDAASFAVCPPVCRMRATTARTGASSSTTSTVSAPCAARAAPASARPSPGGRPSNGSRTENAVPCPGAASHAMTPACSWTMAWVVAVATRHRALRQKPRHAAVRPHEPRLTLAATGGQAVRDDGTGALLIVRVHRREVALPPSRRHARRDAGQDAHRVPPDDDVALDVPAPEPDAGGLHGPCGASPGSRAARPRRGVARSRHRRCRGRRSPRQRHRAGVGMWDRSSEARHGRAWRGTLRP